MNTTTLRYSLLLTILSANLSATTLPEQRLIPGGLAIIPLTVPLETEPEVFYQNQRVTLIPDSIEKPTQWLALIGIPLKTPIGNQEFEIKLSDNTLTHQTFQIKPKDYPVQRLTIKEKNKVEPTPAELERIGHEQVRINKARASYLANIPDLRLNLPVKGRLSSQFGLQRFFNNLPRDPHGGLDIAAVTGTPILAPADGTVIETGDFFFNGNSIFIDHGKGLISFYAHLSRMDVKPGQKVKRGELLGAVGATGRATGPHLHWAVGLNGTWIDPQLFLGAVQHP